MAKAEVNITLNVADAYERHAEVLEHAADAYHSIGDNLSETAERFRKLAEEYTRAEEEGSAESRGRTEPDQRQVRGRHDGDRSGSKAADREDT